MCKSDEREKKCEFVYPHNARYNGEQYSFQWYIRKFHKKACNSISCKVVFIKLDNRNC